jgi:hypothetical protein
VFWGSAASSANGNKLVATAGIEVVSAYGAGCIFISTNRGTTWTQADAPFKLWSSVASSADGSKLVGSADPNSMRGFSGGIYTGQITPAPQLNLAPTNGNFMLSWIVPSTNFVMQQSADLTSWADVTNPPILNLTNLQNEVTLSPSNCSGFYRLKSP